MALKAKVEAIIYAAEEPITVEQIAQLLKQDVLAEEALLAEKSAVEEAAAAEPQAETNVLEASESTQEPETPLPSSDAAEIVSGSGEELSTDAEPDTAIPASGELTSEPETMTEAVQEHSATAETASAPVPEETSEAPSDIAAPEIAGEPAPADSASVEGPDGTADKKQKKPKREVSEDARIRARIREVLVELINDYSSEERGIEIRQVAGGFRMSTKPEHHDIVRAFAKSLKPPVKLSLAALETLAVIAYKQPITVPEISEIRGVESGGVIGTLLDRKLITTAGRKQVIGRPILYKTSKEFLLRFGLSGISELPSMEEFEKLASDGLFSEHETTPEPEQKPVQEGAAAESAAQSVAPADSEAVSSESENAVTAKDTAPEPQESSQEAELTEASADENAQTASAPNTES